MQWVWAGRLLLPLLCCWAILHHLAAQMHPNPMAALSPFSLICGAVVPVVL